MSVGRRTESGIHRPSSQVHPLLLAVMQRVQANPVQDPRFVSAKLEDGSCGCSIQKMYPASPAGTFQVEPADTMAWNASQVVVAAAQGKTDQLNQALCTTGQMPPQPQQTLAMLAKSVKANCHGPAVRPENLVAFVLNLFPMSVSFGVSTKENPQSTCHPHSLSIVPRVPPSVVNMTYKQVLRGKGTKLSIRSTGTAVFFGKPRCRGAF